MYSAAHDNAGHFLGHWPLFHYYSEIVKGYSNIENLSPLIKRLEKRILDLEKVLTISLNQNLHKSFLCNMYSAAHDNAGHFLGHWPLSLLLMI
jgi:hypothetical protein